MMTSRQKLGLAAALCLLMATACGGGKKEAEEPEPAANVEDDTGDTEEASDSDEVLIPAEKFEEVKRFFDHKRQLVSRCFVKALDAGEVKETDNADVQVTLTIMPDGSVVNARVTSCTPSSKVLRSCVLGHVKSWKVTTLPKKFDYSYTFGMGRL